ncbi:hypothetical protein [Duganella callida]|uniref:DNA-binding protein n=1 Tax=Duganella callida TaxID=2561932 RepID=A0A4Y9S772_9BURK|nr:hypothetical protein [Duganella callida]TFW15924.1 hypothetical protein E4L98_24825 [Duganella callida]
MAAAPFKKNAPVKARSAKTGKVSDGKFVAERPAGKGVFYDVDLGEAGGGVKSFRPSQVTAA